MYLSAVRVGLELQHGLFESLQGQDGLSLLHQHLCQSEGVAQVVLQPVQQWYMCIYVHT